jgi:LMBR1 domain-containing protein 1
MADIALIITSSVFALLVLVGSVYFVVYFQHPDDKWVAWFPKTAVVNITIQKSHLNAAKNR